MLRRPAVLLVILLLALGGCRQEGESTSTAVQDEASPESIATPPPPQAVRDVLDRVEPAIPLWPGARASDQSVREQGSSTIVDLWTNDSFPMVWHYYITYFSQYRGWEPLDPYPSGSEQGRQLQLDLNEVMQDPFIPGTALEPGDSSVTLMIREDLTHNRVNIRYVVRPPAPAEEPANVPDQRERSDSEEPST